MPRKIVICVDDSDASEEAVKWTMANVFKGGDEVHIVHVIPRFQLSGTYGAPPADYLPHQDAEAYEELIKKAESFIAKRVLVRMEAAASPATLVHIIKYETDSDSIGTVLCKKADELDAALLVVSRHDKSKLQQFFLGSVSGFCIQHSKRPVLVHH